MLRNSYKLTLLVGLCFWLIGCEDNGPPGAVPANAVKMKASEIENLMQKTIESNYAFDDAYAEGLRYTPKAANVLSVSSRYISKVIPGAWRVDTANDKLCTIIESDPENCYEFYRISDQSYYIDVPGLYLKQNTLTLVKP